jgi:hypothetical protein
MMGGPQGFRLQYALVLFLLFVFAHSAGAQITDLSRQIAGTVADSKGAVLVGAAVAVVAPNWKRQTVTDTQGQFALAAPASSFVLHVEGRDLIPQDRSFSGAEVLTGITIQVAYRINPVHETLVITTSALQPEIDRRNETVYKETLFNRGRAFSARFAIVTLAAMSSMAPPRTFAVRAQMLATLR